MKRHIIGIICASVLTSLALSGCAGAGGADDDRIGAFGTGYGSNGARLFERDDDHRPRGNGGAGGAGRRTGVADGPDMMRMPGEDGRRSGMFGSEDEGNGSRDGGGAGRFGVGTFSGRLTDGDKLDATRSFRVGNGYDGITSDGAGSSDPKGKSDVSALEPGGAIALQLGGIRIADGSAASAAESAGGDGGRVLRVTSPAARAALKRLSRSLSSGGLASKADQIASDLRIVLKNAR